MTRFFCCRYGDWMIRDWHLYHWVKVVAVNPKITFWQWRKMI